MNTRWVLLGIAVIWVQTVEANPAMNSTKLGMRDHKSGGKCLDCIRKGISKVESWDEKFSSGEKVTFNHHHKRGCNCPRRCPRTDFPDILMNIQNLRNDVTSVKETVTNVINGDLLVELRRQLSLQKTDTISEIKKYLEKFKNAIDAQIDHLTVQMGKGGFGGGTGGGGQLPVGGDVRGDINVLTAVVMELGLKLEDLVKKTKKSDSSQAEASERLLQYEVTNSETLKTILSELNRLALGGGGSGQSSEVRISKEIIDKLKSVVNEVRESTKEVKHVAQEGSGNSWGKALQQQLQQSTELLERDINSVKTECLAGVGEILSYSRSSGKEIQTLKQTISSTTESLKSVTAEEVLRAIKKAGRNICSRPKR